MYIILDVLAFNSLDVDDQILAGHTFNYKDVQDRYLDKLNSQSNTICVFVQDEVGVLY